MTPDELRKLADEATPGPWRWTPEDAARVWQPTQHMLSGIGYHCIAEANDPASRKNAVNARLISLAPDLARLCAELGKELGLAIIDLQTLLDSDALTKTGRKKLANHLEHYQAVLAKLSELKT